jgi:uncharacterized Zn-finger protein
MALAIVVLDGRRFARMVCGECGVEHYLPELLDKKNIEAGPKGGWYCPNGHPRVYTEGASDKLRRERDRLVQQLAEKDDAIAAAKRHAELAERRASAARGQVTKMKNRASKGVCPCCNRHFTDLERHMGTKHPSFLAEADATVSVN